MSTTPRTDAAVYYGSSRASVDPDFARQLERENAALKSELEQAKAERARAAMEERNRCLATMERQKVALEKARDQFVEIAHESVCERSVVISHEALTAINEALGRGNLEAEPEALPDTHADRLPEQRAPDGDSSDPAGKA